MKPIRPLLLGGVSDSHAADFTKIAEVVTTGSQSTISFPTVPATYRHLELSVTARGSAVATQIQLRCQFNGDTAGNYDWFVRDRLNGTPGLGSTGISLGLIPGASVSSDIVSGLTTFIPDYRSTTFQKTTATVSNFKIGTSADTDLYGAQQNAGFWRSTSAIASVLLYFASGNFIDGSVATLYGKL
jgi:hypothetical protein